MKKFTADCRRIFVILLDVFFNHDWFFMLIGKVNRRFHFIDSIFLAYPATKEYALAYVYKRHLYKMDWNPFPSGFIFQNGKLELMFVISNTEEQFISENNRKNLKRVVERFEEIRKLLNASQKRFAGILPGVLMHQRLMPHSVEAEVTVKAVKLAIARVKKVQGYDSDIPLIVLGGKGFIGHKLIKLLKEETDNVHCIDVNGPPEKNECFKRLKGEKAIVVNVTRKAMLMKYLPVFWSELIILNEVYPEPTFAEIRVMKQRGLTCYHVVGVEAKAIPSFPYAYRGGIPCCAAWPAKEMKVIIKEIS